MTSHGLVIQLETVGNIERLPGEVETAIYRIVQESLTNVVRHAQATRVDILLESRGGQLVVIVEDNGVGLTRKPEGEPAGRFGFARTRGDVGWKLSIESSPGKGSTDFLEVPWQFDRDRR